MTEEPQIELKRPGFAALLAWLWPGAGHLYQGRTAKGVLYMVCILGTYFYGLVIGQGHVVYASLRPEDRRLPYLCQVGVGLPALPALLQTRRVRNGQEPWFGGMMAPPYVNPDLERIHRGQDELSQWHAAAGGKFELGTLFTMVAGLLNVLAIYDAFAGPVVAAPDEKQDRPPPDDSGPSKQ
ncbi:MAG: hypothetical protein KDA41_06460 [Planctomycetales bacterium]|nr:hypothetical protein [Planctomycetales bacterium]